MSARGKRIAGDRATEQVDRLVGRAALESDDAQPMQCRRLRPVLRQDGAVDPLGPLDVAPAPPCVSDLQGLVEAVRMSTAGEQAPLRKVVKAMEIAPPTEAMRGRELGMLRP